MHEIWDTVRRLIAWLDEKAPASPEATRLLRVLKISEEAGEVAEALHGVLGANPRKGHSHTWADVERELADVILTAMIALHTLTPDAESVLDEHVRRVAERSSAGT